MALKKSQLYSSIWQSCDELRGGMDASQYKDYVLVMLFVKYVSDKYTGVPYSAIKIPEGASFADMVALKGKSDIGDQINKKIIGPLAAANSLSDMPDFNDPTKLGTGKERVDRLTNLIAIFQNPDLNFSKNRADGDDILGDAYEYLMRHFATESGKSKGQFYTPAEVSRIMARVIGIRDAATSNDTTVYDPTCGSGSLLLKVGDEATADVTLYGQEKEATNAGLARMNMILHDNATALIEQGNTLANPLFTENGQLKTFDYVVANPPFSDKRWSTGLNPLDDPHDRFTHFGVPPAKQGDYAYLLHIVRSLKSDGRGACILPHGVLFRGNVEAEIRKNLVRKGYIKGIIGLPPNLFYGTGIPACIVVIDKEGTAARRGVFMIDASKGFVKDGNKNRLREMDIHKIVDVFEKQTDVPRYARMVSFEEIEKKNDFNLNIPRYIDSQEAEDIQDIEGHLRGGIPEADIDALEAYWTVYPGLRATLFKPLRPGYVELAVDKASLRSTIYEHAEFAKYIAEMEIIFGDWRDTAVKRLKQLEPGFRPKELIAELGESLLAHYASKPLIKHYDVYQHLMDYWAETMQDDSYLIAADGWKAETYRVIETDKKGNQKDKGWTCDLVSKALVVIRYFGREQAEIAKLSGLMDGLNSELDELEEEHGGEEGALSAVSNKTDAQAARRDAALEIWEGMDPAGFAQYATATSDWEQQRRHLAELEAEPRIQRIANAKGRVTQKAINAQTKRTDDAEELRLLERHKALTIAIKTYKKLAKDLFEGATRTLAERLEAEPDDEILRELRVIDSYLSLTERIGGAKNALKEAEAALDAKTLAKYSNLGEEEVKTLVVEDKWLAFLATAVHGEMDNISHALTQRVKELAERYETPLPSAAEKVSEFEQKVNRHLETMGFLWK